jgi:hypothetical protein
MSSNSEETSDDCILYELLVYSEWKQDPELLVTDYCMCNFEVEVRVVYEVNLLRKKDETVLSVEQVNKSQVLFCC